MTEFVWPNLGRQSAIKWRHVSNSEIYPSPLTGGVQTVSRPGDRLACSIDVTNSSGAERAQLRALVARMRGKSNRVYVPNYGFKRRGSFPAPELFVNADFAAGTTGWSVLGGTLSASNGVLRMAANGSNQAQLYQSVALQAYVPFVLRALVSRAEAAVLSAAQQLSFEHVANFGALFSDGGYKLVSGVAQDAAARAQYLFFTVANLGILGDFYDLYFASLSRCFLTDSGGNLFTRSKELDHADWTKAALTVIAGSANGPDGVLDGDKLVPTAVNGSHYIDQTKTISSVGQDVTICGYFLAGGYNFVRLHMQENSSAGVVYQVFNLSTGALGATNGASATWSNLRAVIKNMGNSGWYYCALTAFKNNAATSLDGFAVVQNADSIAAFTGDGTSAIYGSNVTMFPGSSFARPVTSSATAIAAQSQNGSSIRVKGLPASQSGLLLAGDEFEIDRQLKIATASLDSDASGFGILQFEPPLPRAVADNTPIIVQSPLCKMIMIEDGEYDARPGGFSDFHFELVQDLNP